MEILRGNPALSSFRSEILLKALQKQVTSVVGVYADFMHFAHLFAPLTANESVILRRLLCYGPRVEPDRVGDAALQPLNLSQPTVTDNIRCPTGPGRDRAGPRYHKKNYSGRITGLNPRAIAQ
jgi:hypothetical protein